VKPATLLFPALLLALGVAPLRANGTDPHAQHGKTAPATTVDANPVPKGPVASTYRVAIKKSQEGVTTPLLKATQGQQVRIVLASERPGTVEIHGYDRRVALKPGGEATLLVKADQVGRFPVHLHTPEGAHIEVAAFEVQAK
jgi:uncharacterized cupredoxin-like copper-binding protein